MLESLPVMLIVGTVLGFLSGLGIGGGSLLILWLTMVIGMDAATARGINLLFFLPAALICAIFRLRQGNIPFRNGTCLLSPSVISAGTWLRNPLAQRKGIPLIFVLAVKAISLMR